MVPYGTIYELMSLPDLVQAKKTQRDKDWPMIRRLIEADRAACRDTPSEAQVRFWLSEGRTPELLIELARVHPDIASELVARRRLLAAVIAGNETAVEDELAAEERAQRHADKAYWEPLKRELERMRREK